jgi:hypothetical protein
MTHRRLARRLVAAIALVLLILAGWSGLSAQPPGKGMKDEAFATDRDVFHFLLDHRADVRRTVKVLENGVETVTESDRPEVAAKIREHVAAMHKRVQDGTGIRLRDPLFATIFKHHNKIAMKVERTEKGVKVTETSDDPYVARLIRAHAAVVSKFVENGHAEARKDHPVPGKSDPK